MNVIFHNILGNIIIPTDEVHHFSEGFKPPVDMMILMILFVGIINSHRFPIGFPLESSDDEKSLPWNLAGLGVPKLGTFWIWV